MNDIFGAIREVREKAEVPGKEAKDESPNTVRQQIFLTEVILRLISDTVFGQSIACFITVGAMHPTAILFE